jgi:hypothetical protein
MFKEFHQCSGLKLNVEKTLVAWLGSKKGKKEQQCKDLKLQWTTTFKLLGITFNTLDVGSSIILNLDSKLTEMTRTLQQYNRRNLTIIGKVTVVKTLILPKIIHILSVLPSPGRSFINKLNEIISQFIWRRKKGKINRNLLAQNTALGGLKLTHLQSQIDSLKIRWVRYLILENREWTTMFETVTGIEDWENIQNIDPKSLITIASRISNPFWSEVIMAWAKLVKAYKVDETHKILNYSLKDAWYIRNPNLKGLLNILKYLGCEKIGDLYEENMKIIAYEEFRRKYIDLNFLDYASLISSIPKTWKRHLSRLTKKPELVELDLQYKIITQPKTCKLAYQIFIKALSIHKPHEQKWREDMPDLDTEKWSVFNNIPFQCTLNTKLQAFQYKVIHRLLGTRKLLKQCKIIEEDTCIWCQEDSETLLHMFVTCPTAQSFWNKIKEWLDNYIENDLGSETIIFGDQSSEAVSNIVINLKYYMFVCSFKEQRPDIVGAKQIVRAEMMVEREIAKKNEKAEKLFDRKWGLLQNILEV